MTAKSAAVGTAHGVPLSTLKECLMFLEWLKSHSNMQRQTASNLYERIKKYYKISNMKNDIEKSLSQFLTNVSNFYNRLCYVRVAGNYNDKTAAQIVDTLLDCLPRFISALHYLWYDVNATFEQLGGGGWKNDYPGAISSYWYSSYGGDLDAYLHAQPSNKYGGLMPGGFTSGDVRYNQYYDGYRQGFNMAPELGVILNTSRHNYLLDVLVISILSDCGTRMVNSANVLALVGTFCAIVETDPSGSKLKEAVQKKDTCIKWTELKQHCTTVKSQMHKVFRKEAFDHTGQSLESKDINMDEFAKVAANWLRANLRTVRDNLQKIKTDDPAVAAPNKDNLGAYFTENLYPYGFILEDNHFKRMISRRNALLQHHWRDVLNTLLQPRNGLDRLRELLEGGACPPKKPEIPPSTDIKSDTARTVATKTEATKTEAAKPVVTKAEAAKPTATKTEATKPVAAKPTATKTEATKTEAAKPVVTKAEAAKPTATKTEVTKPQAKNAGGSTNQNTSQSGGKPATSSVGKSSPSPPPGSAGAPGQAGPKGDQGNKGSSSTKSTTSSSPQNTVQKQQLPSQPPPVAPPQAPAPGTPAAPASTSQSGGGSGSTNGGGARSQKAGGSTSTVQSQPSSVQNSSPPSLGAPSTGGGKGPASGAGQQGGTSKGSPGSGSKATQPAATQVPAQAQPPSGASSGIPSPGAPGSSGRQGVSSAGPQGGNGQGAPGGVTNSSQPVVTSQNVITQRSSDSSLVPPSSGVPSPGGGQVSTSVPTQQGITSRGAQGGDPNSSQTVVPQAPVSSQPPGVATQGSPSSSVPAPVGGQGTGGQGSTFSTTQQNGQGTSQGSTNASNTTSTDSGAGTGGGAGGVGGSNGKGKAQLDPAAEQLKKHLDVYGGKIKRKNDDARKNMENIWKKAQETLEKINENKFRAELDEKRNTQTAVNRPQAPTLSPNQLTPQIHPTSQTPPTPSMQPTPRIPPTRATQPIPHAPAPSSPSLTTRVSNRRPYFVPGGGRTRPQDESVWSIKPSDITGTVLEDTDSIKQQKMQTLNAAKAKMKFWDLDAEKEAFKVKVAKSNDEEQKKAAEIWKQKKEKGQNDWQFDKFSKTIEMRNERKKQAAKKLDETLKDNREEIWDIQQKQHVDDISSSASNDTKKRLQQKRLLQKKQSDQQQVSRHPATTTPSTPPSQPSRPVDGPSRRAPFFTQHPTDRTVSQRPQYVPQIEQYGNLDADVAPKIFMDGDVMEETSPQGALHLDGNEAFTFAEMRNEGLREQKKLEDEKRFEEMREQEKKKIYDRHKLLREAEDRLNQQQEEIKKAVQIDAERMKVSNASDFHVVVATHPSDPYGFDFDIPQRNIKPTTIVDPPFKGGMPLAVTVPATDLEIHSRDYEHNSYAERSADSEIRPRDVYFDFQHDDPFSSLGSMPIHPQVLIEKADFKPSKCEEDDTELCAVGHGSSNVDLQIQVPDRTIQDDSYDVNIDEPPLPNLQPLDPIDPVTTAINLDIEPIDPPESLPNRYVDPYTHDAQTVGMCIAPWMKQTEIGDSTDIPETELFPAQAPRTVRDMLQWLAGLKSEKHHSTLRQCIDKAFGGSHSDFSQLALSVNGSYIRPKDVFDILQLTSMFAGSVLTSIAPNWRAHVSSKPVQPKPSDQSDEPDCCALICQLRDYVYACHHQLEFLKSQCNRDKLSGGWKHDEYGRDITPTNSHLQAFLTDDWDSTFDTHPFDPCNLCHKSRIRMGFQAKDLPEKSQLGSVISAILSPSCGGSDPLLTLSSYLNCLTRRTPRTTGELVSYFHNFGNSLHDMYLDTLSPLGTALAKSHADCPDWDHLGRHDLQAVSGIRGQESLISKHNSNYSNDHLRTLSTLVGCGSDPDSCHPHCSPITYRAYALYSQSFAHTYLSWAVYLPDLLWESLQKLFYELKKHVSTKCSSLHLCSTALPLLYTHGFTPPEGKSQSPLTCQQVIAKLQEIVNGGPIATLMTTMDNFLYNIREPFIYTIVALWSTALLVLANTMLYRLDILHIRSHLIRTKASHLIDVKALLTKGRKMLSLYKDVDYFDEDPIGLLGFK
ncbi:hypothetical protein BBBOND_0309170 [Babesia bigemina]|uniref:Ribosome-binding protein 1 n=1 Tax=Babesia bigemina TaxID=5866 RepID=A0A061DD07_BABBI|nr:hypothetical protein BBBOND_0309170 [Babesia bigemina]CDR97014.1 hypothetical protein BBBOND_0309170 [Babesia bigemina]|eukprot:XP_012769200.1 hypothetical protein BBBOND_0309170 [Babesia bigemina]